MHKGTDRRYISVFLALAVLAGCSRFTVETKYDRKVNFTPLRTYSFRPGIEIDTGDPRFDDQLLDQRLRDAIEHVLAKKGFRLADEKTKPDFYVGYYIALRQNTRLQNNGPSYVDGSWGWRDTYEYDEGTLQIDIVDSTNSKLLWRGAGAGVVDPTASPATRQKRIKAAVAQILSKFPPKPGVSLS